MTDHQKVKIRKLHEEMRDAELAARNFERDNGEVLVTYWNHVERYNHAVEEIRAAIKTSTQSDPKDEKRRFGTFELRPSSVTLVDIPDLIKKAPAVLREPDVVTEVSQEALHRLVMAGKLSGKVYTDVITTGWKTPSLYGPQPFKRPFSK